MFRTIIVIASLLLPSLIYCQKVDSIKVEQSGDFIKIRYMILNSSPDQIYKVKILCSVNGGLNMELKSVSGDAGDHVVGGKPEYWAVWDVLKDVDEINSVEFIVRAELEESSNIKVSKDKNWPDKKIHFYAVADRNSGANLFGLRVGYFGKWGVSAKIAKGSVIDNYVLGHESEDTEVPLLNTSLDLAARIVNAKDFFQMYYLLGIGYCKMKAEDDNEVNTKGSVWEMHFGIDQNLVFDIGRVSIIAGGTFFLPSSKAPEGYNVNGATFSAGLGLKF
jgi:hypothetical protein